MRLPVPTGVEVAEKDSEPAQEEAVITKKPKIRGARGAPIHGNMCPDTHRARKPQIPTPPHSCPSAMYADTWSSLFKKIKKSHDRSGSYFTTTAERKGTHWPWLVHGRKTFETPTPMGPDTELHPLEAPTLRGESVKLLKTDPSINKSIQH